jgi:dynactin complex subunit
VGNNDGTVTGHEYFTCRQPACGVLVDPRKVRPLRNVVAADVGKRVVVKGYTCHGTLCFVGPHHLKKKLRCGVALDLSDGMNDGTVKGQHYFSCKPGHGILTIPSKVSLLDQLAG